MDKVIVSLALITAFAWLSYKAYRFLIKKEITTCCCSDYCLSQDQSRTDRENAKNS